ncbi:protein kinase-like domain, Phloem protein 2-like protein [Artemisia annua]|uniref:non-specific serine/threonine protein kinase n=1 Tax=Artemisia annua TaxID=35608 RepID=A0A2U1MND2_ARTAN|nr:protein kinase-like domain, Phloem protein 2-like protein [Artemisia annua]
MSSLDDFAHLRIPLEDILSATNNFDDEYICGEDAFENYFEGQLLWSGELVNIYAGRLKKERFDGDQQFWMELSMLSSLKHKNLVSLVGFCDDNDEKVIIFKRETRLSLGDYLSDPMLLTWVRRLEISVGVAQALSYIHYDESRDFSVIHRNINSSLIYLNDDWEPKLGDFICSMKIKASERHNSFNTDKVWSTDGYTDPVYIETKSAHHKSDMYSFGIVMFELLCGTKSVIASDYNKYLAPVAITHYREKKLDEIIDWGLLKQMDSQSVNMFAEIAYDCLKEERSQRPDIDEIVPRLVKVLELQLEHQNVLMSLPSNEFAHLRVPLEIILSATNNFDEANVILEYSFEQRYKGQLLWSGELIDIHARRFNKDEWDDAEEQEFWKEISMLSSLKHKNLVSLVGFCNENDEKIIIVRLDKRGSLSNYLSDPMLLTWVRRLEISIGIAHALSYIHYDELRNFSVIHRNINSNSVVLNDDWEPKLSNFECSMKIEATQRHRSFQKYDLKYVEGYGDPTYIETKRVNHKSDMYSFGIVLFELLCGRKSVSDDQDKKYLGPVAITHFREERLDEIIDWDLYKQMDSQSFEIFAKIAYDCLNEEMSQRPSINEIAPRLEEALKIARMNSHIMSSPKDDLAHLKIPLESILSATNNFADVNIIATSGFGKSFKGQLLWSGDLIDIHARRLNKERDEQQFWMDISLLSSLKHKNVVSLVGFCDENGEKVIIYKLENRGSLNQYLSDPMLLTWVRRLEISVGIAHALSYIHYDEPRDFSVIHRLITSGRVLLNDDWEPKLSSFELSMKIKSSERHHSFHTNRLAYVIGYGDPTYIETKSVNHKSDIYSFGIVLFELLCGREAPSDNQDNKYLGPVVITHYREKKLVNIIDKDLWKQIDLHSFNMFAEIAYEGLDEERSRRPNIDDIVPRLEEALKLARENRPIHSPPSHLAHLRIPIEDIESATNYFAEENVIGTSGFYKAYKGELSWSGELIDISARRLINKEWDDEKEQQFWTEIFMLSNLKHKNFLSIVGFCNEVGAETIICKREKRGSLNNYLSDPVLLTWVKRLEICVGIAHALSYIHCDEPRGFSIILGNISSETVLLNNDWEPKLYDFQLSMEIKASERHHSFHTDSVWSTEGYTDPTCLETNIVNHKSDIYSFGIVLFELLCGWKSVSDDQDNKYLAPVAIFHYREQILDDIIDPKLRKQMDPRSQNTFAETAYECLNEEQSQRPNMDQIVTSLEKALELQLECENAEHSSVVDEVGGTSSSHEKGSASHSTSTGVESNSRKKTMSSLKYLSHSELSAEDIKSATNNFSPENRIRENTVAWVYQGRMLHSGQFIDIVARGCYLKYQKDENKKYFRMEKSMLSSLNHMNLVSVIGFRDKNLITVYKKEANGSLNKYLSDETLTWMQRLKICLGVANALSYIHYDVGRDFSVIHCNIRSSKILLDDEWEPKLSGFELARRHRLLLTRDIVKNVYLDPKYNKTGGVTHKSDVYSFGVVLYEVVCGRSAVLPDEELGDGLLTQLKKSQLDEMIMPHIQKQVDPEAFKIFSETAYFCIQEERAKRPHIDQVVKRLEKALEHQWKHENPVDRTSFNRLKEKNLEHLKIGLDVINVATKNFDDAYCIGSGGFGKVYKADLEYFESSNSSSKEGVDKCVLPRKRSTVAIKRIYNQEGEQGFIAEIETLITCKHQNVISLLGFCYDQGNGAMILVYEHASKGSLQNYLGSSDKLTNLNWLQRLNICLDIAHGLNYIHNNTDHGKQKMIHRDIKSDNILLEDNWKAKIADFGLSKFHPAHQAASTIYTDTVAGTYVYLDPEYQKDGRLNKKSDIYSFGVVLLEILTGRLAYDYVYTGVNEKGIAPIARDHFEKGTVMEIVDHKIKEETDEHVFSLSKGPNKESLDIFLEIAFRCVAETQAQRPTIEVVINELKKALDSQENHKDNLKLSLEDIKLATKGFSQDNIIGHGDSGNVYKGATQSTHGHNIIAAKRLDNKSGQGDAEVLTELAAAKFMAELDILMEYKHLNVIGLVGYCDEEDEKVIVYEFASRGGLDKYLTDDSLTWVMRLKICIDIAIGLEFLHGTVSSPEMVIHRDISSNNILLFDDWKAKISGFGLSLVCPRNQNVDYVIDNVTGTIGYRDPLHLKTGFLTKESDIFSLGAVLFDILCGKLSSEKLDDEYFYLPFLAKQHYHEGKLDKLVFEGIKEQIVPQSYITFTRIAFQCLHHRRERRPTADEVVIQLKKSLEFQEDYEKWEPKLSKDYKEIIQMSKCPEIYSTIKKEDLYNIFSKGILLQQDKVLLSFNGNGERNKMVSAAMFSYKNSCPHEWKSLQESRFETVVEMFDISKLNIEIKTNAQLLSPDVVYAVYLVFKLSDSRQFSSNPMYVNLKYRNGPESLHAYFATWRQKGWMMIQLYQFLNQNEDIVFDFLLESFSSYHCGDGAVYVEGIEFRAIDEVKHEEIGKLKEVQQVLKSDFNVDQVQQLPTNFEEIFKIRRKYEELFWLGEVNGKKLLVLSAKAVLYKYSNVDLFSSKPLAETRFQEVIELLPQQVFHLNCTIKRQMLSQDTEYMCYLVFKLSEKCQGLHCPVKVRDVLHKENNEVEFVYFITPSALNINGNTQVPKQREDGWMQIQVWKFNSAHEFKDDSLSMDIKFTSHEGSMSGLIVCGLEFRPMFFGNSDDIQRQREKKRMLQEEAQNPHIQPKKDEKMTE